MRHSLSGLCVAAVILGASSAAVAHHGAATFDTGKTLVLEGVVTEWVWANPHCFLKFDVKGPDGKVESWAVEAGGASALMRAGVRRTDFTLGVELTVQGFMAKNGTKTIAGREVKTADGRNFFVGGQQPGRGGQ